MKSETEEIPIICAWCDKPLGFKEMEISPALRGAVARHLPGMPQGTETPTSGA